MSTDLRVQASRLQKLVYRAPRQRWAFVFDNAQDLDKQDAWRAQAESCRSRTIIKNTI